MHLDTVFTLLDRDKATAYPKVVSQIKAVSLRPGASDDAFDGPGEQRFGGAADSGAPHLGVDDDAPGHRQIGAAVHIGVADAVEMLEDGDAALRRDALDQRPPAARHDDVDQIVELEQRADRGAIGGGDELDRRFRE